MVKLASGVVTSGDDVVLSSVVEDSGNVVLVVSGAVLEVVSVPVDGSEVVTDVTGTVILLGSTVVGPAEHGTGRVSSHALSLWK